MGEMTIPVEGLRELISIPAEEYKELVKAKVRMEILTDHVIKSKYIDRADCVLLLGIELNEHKEKEDAGTD